MFSVHKLAGMSRSARASILWMHRQEHRRPLLAAMLLNLFTVNQAECALTALESTIVLILT